MTIVFLLIGAMAGFLIGLWLLRMTRSDTWERVCDLERRVADLESKQ